jgi:Rrf2 family protein
MSDAASLALHATALLASDGRRVHSTRALAEALEVSEAHLSKVMQRLTKVGLVRSVRGPKGGFALDRSADETSLLDVYEAIEGPMERSLCLLGKEKCSAERCILGDALASADRILREYLTATKLSDLVDAFGGTP